MNNLTAQPVRSMVSPEEWQLRTDLAAAYRLFALFGWEDLIFTHISARVPGPDRHFLINPYGMLFDEITASTLVKVDLDGAIVLGNGYEINPAGFVIHSAIHAAREDAICVMHSHTVNGIAVSAQRDGLKPISLQAMVALTSLGYHDFEGIVLADEEKPRLVADLGMAKALILRNHGLLTVGSNVQNAFLTMYNLELACRVQVAASANGDALIDVPPHLIAGTKQRVRTATLGRGPGALVWPALLRRLDRVNPGYGD